MANLRNKIIKDLIVFDNENNLSVSVYDITLPKTVLDAVYDQNDPNEITLREILAAMKRDIAISGIGSIDFPVKSVNGMFDDVVIRPIHLGLERVDNTKDMEKPLSDPQRLAVTNMLSGINLSTDFSEMMNHTTNMSNPHNVTIDQINNSGSVTALIDSIVMNHNISTTAHTDIRTNLNDFKTLTNTNITNVNNKITTITSNYDTHILDNTAHNSISKENISNKTPSFTKTINCDDVKYPTTKAVVEYVANATYGLGGVTIDEYVSSIDIINNNDDLPAPGILTYGRVYLIRNVNNSIYSGLAVCKKNGSTYEWFITNFIISKYDTKYFKETNVGLTFDASTLPSLDNIYTQQQADDRFISTITMRAGTNDGTLAFYTDGNIGNIVDNIPVAGLGPVAFVSQVKNANIAPNAVTDINILDNTITGIKLASRTITSSNIVLNGITNDVMADNSITERNLGDNSVSTRTMINGSVTNAKLSINSVTAANVSPNSITYEHLEDNTVVESKLAPNSVTTLKIAPNAVENSRLALMDGASLKGNMNMARAQAVDIPMQMFLDYMRNSTPPPILYNDTEPYVYSDPDPNLVNQYYKNNLDIRRCIWIKQSTGVAYYWNNSAWKTFGSV